MSKKKITVLVENTAGKPGLLGEHGLSFLIETEEKRILFDTGQGMALFHNAGKLSVDLKNLDSIVLSHGHYDHTGGLADVLAETGTRVVFSHPDVIYPKFSQRTDGSAHYNGMAAKDCEALRGAEWIHVNGCLALGDGVYLTGPIPRQTDFEDAGGRFFKDSECKVRDELPDDLALFCCTKKGTVILSGCAHAGAVNLINYVRGLTSNRPVYAFVGGTHLIHSDSNRIDRTVDALRTADVCRLALCHCTGPIAVARIWNAFPEHCEPCSAGTVFGVED